MKAWLWVSVVLQSLAIPAGAFLAVTAMIRLLGPSPEDHDWVLLTVGVILMLSAATVLGIHLWAWRRGRAELDEVVSRLDDAEG